jgi:hypothetical protein
LTLFSKRIREERKEKERKKARGKGKAVKRKSNV